jgi:hypothetical protein
MTFQHRTSTVVWNMLTFLGMVCALATAVLLTIVMPSFRTVFEAFGAELRFPTDIVVKYYWLSWMLPAAAFLVWASVRNGSRRARLAAGFGIWGLALIGLAMMLSMYLPIYALG